jgi:hypothetical protein
VNSAAARTAAQRGRNEERLLIFSGEWRHDLKVGQTDRTFPPNSFTILPWR